MRDARRLLWVIPVYVVIFIGMYVLPNAWIALLGFHLTLIVPLLPHLRTLPARLLHPVSPALLLAMALIGILTGVGLWLLWPCFGVSGQYRAQLAALGLTGTLPCALFIGYFGLVNPWLEEAFWRGALADPARGLAPVDFLFAGYHLIILVSFVGPFWLSVVLCILVASGWLWRTIARVTGSLLPLVVCHMLADFSIACALYQRSL